MVFFLLLLFRSCFPFLIILLFFSIWDWGTGAKTTMYQSKSARVGISKITALEWINGHDVALLLVAADDGSVRVFKPNIGISREPVLISAWQAFTDFKPKFSGVYLVKCCLK